MAIKQLVMTWYNYYDLNWHTCCDAAMTFYDYDDLVKLLCCCLGVKTCYSVTIMNIQIIVVIW